MKTPTLPVRVQLPLGWNTYLLFNTDTVSFVWKNNERERERERERKRQRERKTERETESIDLLIFVYWRRLNSPWMKGGGVGQKALFCGS